MKETLHVIFNESAKATLSTCLKSLHITDSDILMFCDDLSHGAIYKDFSDKELKSRSEIFYRNVSDDYPRTFLDSVRSFIHFRFDEYKKIVVWHGNNQQEKLLLYMTCYLTDQSIYEVNITKTHVYNNHINTLSVCSPKDIEFLLPHIEPVSSERKEEYIKLWHKHRRSEAELRIFEDNRIIDVPVDYFDNLILHYCTNEFQKSARIVGTALTYCNQYIGDGFFFNRLLQLVREGKLEICANEEIEQIENNSQCAYINGINVTYPRYYSVKLKEAGNTTRNS